MPRTVIDRIMTAVTEPLFERDKLEMQSIDTLLATIAQKPRQPKRRSTTKNRKRPGKKSR